jgi:hypothetical protein
LPIRQFKFDHKNADKRDMYRRFFCISALLAAFALLPVAAADLSVVVVEADVVPDTPLRAASRQWEHGMLDVFFEAGHIVSDGRTFQINQKPDKGNFHALFQSDIQDAVDGGEDYLVLASLDYRKEVQNKGTEKNIPASSRSSPPLQNPASVTISVYAVRKGKVLYSATIPGNTRNTMKNELENARRAAWNTLPYLGGAL